MTAVNIQHFESVQDIVSRVTGVDVQERVPDRVLRQADAIVNVDLPSAELQERLRAGKIYPADRIGPALENFFTEKNLASLRELAMRQIADRLEAERRGQYAAAASEPVATKAMVAMSSNAETTRRLLRRASALAGKLNTNWFAVYVRTPRDGPQQMSAREHRLLSENVRSPWSSEPRSSGSRRSTSPGSFGVSPASTASRSRSSESPLLAGGRRLVQSGPIEEFARSGSGIDVYEIERITAPASEGRRRRHPERSEGSRDFGPSGCRARVRVESFPQSPRARPSFRSSRRRVRAPRASRASGVLRVVLGRELFGEGPALFVGGKPEIAVGRERHARSGRRQTLEVRRKARGRHAIDAEGVRSERQERPSRVLDRLAREEPALPVRDEGQDRRHAGRLRGRQRGGGFANRVVGLREDQIHAGVGQETRPGAVRSARAASSGTRSGR